MHVFKAPCMDLWVTLPSTGADIVQFKRTHHLKNCCVCPITTPFCSPVDKSVFVSICFGVCLSLDNDFTCAMSMHVLNNTCIHAHTCLLTFRVLHIRASPPFVNLVTVKDIPYQTPKRVQTVSRHPLKGLIFNESLSESVFLKGTYIHARPTNHWGFSSWIVDRKSLGGRRRWKTIWEMWAMSRSYLQCVRTKTETDSELQHRAW